MKPIKPKRPLCYEIQLFCNTKPSSTFVATTLISLLVPLASSATGIDFANQMVIDSTQLNAKDVEAVDLDGDGDLDLVVAAGGGKVTWFANDGNGAYGPELVIDSSASGVYAIVTADIDGDGDVDIAAARQFAAGIDWYESDGASPPTFTEHNEGVGALDFPYSVSVADVDRDGDVDILGVGFGDLAWFENNGAQPPVFTKQNIDSDPNRGNAEIDAADIDGDGDIDFAIADFFNSDFSWYTNNGSNPPVFTRVTVDNSASASAADVIRIADINQDGLPDIVGASQTGVSWYPNLGSGTFAQNSAVLVSAPLTINGVVIGTGGSNRTLDVRDMDYDGDLDVLSATWQSNTIRWFENKSSGQSWTQYLIECSDPSCVGNTNIDDPLGVIAGDLDRDGDLEVSVVTTTDHKLASYDNQSIHRQHWFVSNSAIDSGLSGAVDLEIFDADGDGLKDVVVASAGNTRLSWYEVSQSGNLSTPANSIISNTAGTLISVGAADIDRDGDDDLLALSSSADQLKWYRNDGAGNFSVPANGVIVSTLNDAVSAMIQDVDQDGDPDIVVWQAGSSDQIAFYSNNGSGSFAAATSLLSENDPLDVAFHDLNSDGLADLLLTNSAGELKVSLASAQGVFSASSIISTGLTDPQGLTLMDVNRDGSVDIVVAASGLNSIHVFTNNGAGAFSAQGSVGSLAGVHKVMAIDYDLDGDKDLLALLQNDQLQSINNSNGVLSASQTVSFAAGAVVAARAGDFDQDGQPDVLVINEGGLTLDFIKNMGGHFAISATGNGPKVVLDGDAQLALTLDVSHQGLASDSNLNIESIPLQFIKDNSQVFSSAELQSVLSNVRLYKDNGDNSFDSGTDTLLVDESGLTVTSGELSLSVPQGADSLIPAAGSIRYFVELVFGNNASTSATSAVSVTNPQRSATASNASVSSIALLQKSQPAINSGLLTALSPAPVVDLDTLAAGHNASAGYIEGSGAVSILANVSVSDPDSTQINSASLTLSGILNAGQELLSVNVGATGIMSGYDSGTGLLSLSNGASLADYQMVIQSLSYENQQASASLGQRNVNVVLSDSDANSSDAVQLLIDVVDSQAPVLDLNGALSGTNYFGSYTENALPTRLSDASFTLVDTDSANLDQIVVLLTNPSDGNAEIISATGVGAVSVVVDQANHKLTLQGPASLADFTQSFDTLRYEVSGENPTPGVRIFQTQATDTGSNNLSITVQSEITVVSVNDSPNSLSLNFTDIDENANAAVIGGLTALDPEGQDMTYQIVGGAQAALMTIVNNSLRLGNGISVDYEQTPSLEVTIEVQDSFIPPGSQQQTFVIPVVNLNDEVPVLNLDVDNSQGSSPGYSGVYENFTSAVSITDNDVSIVDPDQFDLSGVMVSIQNVADAGMECLMAQSAGNISASYNAASGELMLTGAASNAAYASVIATIQYRNDAALQSNGARNIEFIVDDGVQLSVPVVSVINVTANTEVLFSGNFESACQ
ncbi:MAG: FG-GAP-like repeat-containing protein [bacterium]